MGGIDAHLFMILGTWNLKSFSSLHISLVDNDAVSDFTSILFVEWKLFKIILLTWNHIFIFSAFKDISSIVN